MTLRLDGGVRYVNPSHPRFQSDTVSTFLIIDSL